MLGQLAAALWEITAVAFLVLVVFTVRKARARGKRLFVDLPKQRLGPPPARTPEIDHRWDAM